MFKHPTLQTDTDMTPKRPTVNTGKGLTKQSMRNETDINLIMSKYQKTGVINFVNDNRGEYMTADPIDFQSAMNTVLEAQQMFSEMPSSLRKKFNNSPEQFLEFVHDPSNQQAMVDLGLATDNGSRPAPAPAPAATPASATPADPTP